MRPWLALAFVACWSQAAPPRPIEIRYAPVAQVFALPNGLRVVALPDANATEVQVTMRYGAGSIDDARGAEGTAHLVEHLLYQHVQAGETLFARLERIATSFNGFTELETTTFTERGPVGELDAMLALEAARLTLPCGDISADTFAREREVVRNELQQKADLFELDAAIHAGLYPDDHPYRAPGETPASVGTITQERACAFVASHYSAGSAVVVVSGNITAATVERAARAALASLPARPAFDRAKLPAITARPTVQHAPIDTAVLVYGWPLPDDPFKRARIRALAAILADHVDREVHGTAIVREFGGERARTIALAVVPDRDVPLGDILAPVAAQVAALPTSFDNQRQWDYSFEHARGVALQRLLGKLEDGVARDAAVADLVRAGRDPGPVLALEVQAVAELDRASTIELARTTLRPQTASIVSILPESAHRTGRRVELAAPIHDAGMRRIVEDPAGARRAEPARPPDPALAKIVARTLPNGLRVVLLPLGSVPVVEIRAVIAAGSADEPPDQHGIAVFTAESLGPGTGDLPDIVKFYTAGGTLDRDVGFDHTTFTTRGAVRELDVLLAGVERLVRNGGHRSAAEVHERMKLAAGADTDVAADAAWRTAVYGWNHPYTTAGLLRDARFDALDERTATAFQARHYRPDTTTIIVAGGFDPKLANRWIDHLFTDWVADGVPPRRRDSQAALLPSAIAVPDDTTLVRVQVALPIAAPRAHALLATELVRAALADARHQIGATYGLTVGLDEARLATRIAIVGYVDARRAADVVALVRDRLIALHTPSDDTASLFVAARRRLLAQLATTVTGSGDLADRAERAAIAGRFVTADRDTAEAVRVATIADLAATLQTLDVGHAAILLRGPQDAVSRAYQGIGLTAQPVR